jgi:limonene 1,2-monooxygenase
MLGIDPSTLRERMLEAAGVIVRLMRGEVVTHESDWFNLREARLQVRPFQLPSMEMVVAAVASPSGPRTSGRLGIGMINMSATAAEAFQALNNHWSIVEAEAEQSGQEVSRSQWRLAGMTHIAETEEQAREDLRYGFEEIWRHIAQVGGALPISDATNFDDLLDESIEKGRVTVGTPDTLVRVIRELAKQTGGFGTFIMTLTGFTDFAPRMRALELYARHVVPEFRGQLTGLRGSNEWVLGQRDGEGTVWKTRSAAAVAKATKDYEAERGAAPTEA